MNIAWVAAGISLIPWLSTSIAAEQTVGTLTTSKQIRIYPDIFYPDIYLPPARQPRRVAVEWMALGQEWSIGSQM
ncbi:MAG: hypothetical protein F6K19_32005 [Cyanothece sp. SIO1E1]|nr:hypothetical protein [Cyanothece sp. SIO1E1]